MRQLCYYFSQFIFITALFLTACQTTQEDEYKAGMDYFNTTYCLVGLPLNDPDTALLYIKNNVPPRWYSLACEIGFFRVSAKTPDTTYLKFLDACDTHLPNAPRLRAFTQMMRGKIFISQLQYDTAVVCLKEAYELSARSGDIIYMSDTKTYMARLAAQRSRYPEAIKLYMEAHDVLKQQKYKDDGRYMELMLNIGRIFQVINDPASAIYWHNYAWRESLQYPEQNKGYQIQLTMALSEDYLLMHHLDSARIMIDSAFKLENRYNSPYLKADRFRILSLIQIEQGQCQTVVPQLQLAYKLNEKPDIPKIVSRHLFALGKGYQCVGKLDSALFYYQNALYTPDSAQQAVIYKRIASVYEQQNNKAKAFDYERLSYELHQRTFTTEKDMAIGRAQVQKDAEERLKRLEKFHQQTYWAYAFGISILIIMLCTVLFWLQKYKQHKQVLAAEKERLLQLESEKTKELTQVQTDLAVKDEELRLTQHELNLKSSFIEALKIELAQKETNTQNTVSEGLSVMRLLTTEDWFGFRALFEQRFPNYIVRLQAELPQLSSSDVRLFLLLKIGFSATEISHMLGISYKSVYTSRYRLRQKIALSENDTLEAFVQRF